MLQTIHASSEIVDDALTRPRVLLLGDRAGAAQFVQRREPFGRRTARVTTPARPATGLGERRGAIRDELAESARTPAQPRTTSMTSARAAGLDRRSITPLPATP